MNYLGPQVLVAASLLAAAPMARAEDDARIRSLTYVPGQVYELETAAGNTLAVIFAPSERIQTVTVGQPQGFQVTVSSLTDSLFVRPLGTVSTSQMTVVTNRRTYEFMLNSGSMSGGLYAVRFAFENPQQPIESATAAVPQTTLPPGEYRLSGNQALRPLAIHDDGEKTYIQWDRDQLMPAVFSIDALGEEAIVDGYVRGGIYTIDRIHSRLIFRIDRRSAQADRRIAGGRQ